jgi:hypothetical protein
MSFNKSFKISLPDTLFMPVNLFWIDQTLLVRFHGHAKTQCGFALQNRTCK